MSDVFIRLQTFERFRNIELEDKTVKSKYALALLLIFAFHVVSNGWVLSRSYVSHRFDELVQIKGGVDVVLSAEHHNLAKWVRYVLQLDHGQSHPRFFQLVEAFSWIVVGGIGEEKLHGMILLTNSIFLLILLLSVYGIGSVLYGPRVGFLAAFLTTMFPLVFGHSRTAMLDYPLTCMICLSFYLLLKTNGFTSTLFSCLFGLFFGLTELTKETAIFFMLCPLGYYLVWSYFQGKKGQIFFNFTLAVLCFFVVAGTVYFQPYNAWRVLNVYVQKTEINTPCSFWYYFEDFYRLVGPIVLVFAVPLLFHAFVHFKTRQVVLFLWFLVPMLLFSIATNKTIRFLLPVLPAFALIVAREVLEDGMPRLLRRVVASLLIFFALAQYILYHGGAFKTLYARSARVGMDDGYLTNGIQFVQKENSYRDTVEMLFCFLKEKVSDLRNRKHILFLFNLGQVLGPLELKMLFARMHYALLGTPLCSDAVDTKRHSAGKDWEQIVSSADYILTLDGWRRYSNIPAVLALGSMLEAIFEKNMGSFVKITSVPISDDSRINVYENAGKQTS